ncbi:hypothetical protein B0J11DRAFT_258636 [Dendryphion nanum]|uniref:Uncharacterized protein n=1 Tax=Dendryphion nanum TaxID=256645 RepID=A0A9P9E4T7_9PLEO|nr:hypothetical protein B0J11DRAFT_258636 [Dendryphion nanum]
MDGHCNTAARCALCRSSSLLLLFSFSSSSSSSSSSLDDVLFSWVFSLSPSLSFSLFLWRTKASDYATNQKRGCRRPRADSRKEPVMMTRINYPAPVGLAGARAAAELLVQAVPSCPELSVWPPIVHSCPPPLALPMQPLCQLSLCASKKQFAMGHHHHPTIHTCLLSAAVCLVLYGYGYGYRPCCMPSMRPGRP